MRKLDEYLFFGFRLAPGVLVFTLALVALPLRRPDGWLLPSAWTTAVGGVALILLGAAWRTRWQRCAGLLALALTGQACALGMIDAPNHGVLQHYMTWRELLTSPKGFLLLGPIGQAVITVGAAWQSRHVMETWLWRLLSGPQVIILMGLTALGAAYGSWDPLRYAGEIALAVWILFVNVVNLILVAATIPGDALNIALTWIRFRSTTSVNGALSAWDRFFPWAAALWVTVTAVILAWAVLERIPHIPDSVGYLFQAKYFSTGQIYLPAPPDPAAFDFEKLHNDGAKWWNYGFPGWPAVLALGVLIGTPWLVNPLLGGVTVLLVHVLLCRLYGRSLARMVVFLLAVSPWFLFMSASFMPHPVSVVWLLLALIAIEKERQVNHGGWGIVAGASLGALFLSRPLEAILLGPLIGLRALGVTGERLTKRAVMGLAAASVSVAALILPYNHALTGGATYFPHQKWADERWYPGADRLGFGPDIGNVGWPHLDPFPGHGPLDVIVNAHQNFYTSNFELFGWGFGSLGFAVLMLLCGRWNRVDRLFIAIILLVVGGHSFYWFSGGPDFGARYWYQILIPLVVLTARGIQELQRRWVESGGAALDALRVSAFVVTASFVAVVNFIPWRSLDKYYGYRGTRADMLRLAQANNFGHSLVFVRDGSKNDYASAFVFNPPTLDSPGTIYARDVGPETRAIVSRHFADRPVWIVTATAPGGPFTIEAGPMPPLRVNLMTSVAGRP